MRNGPTIALAATLFACASSSGSSSGDPAAATPVFSPGGGTYASSQTVTITSATPGATVRCTQDGSPATAASPTCGSPITVSSTRTIRAIATAPAHADSVQASATYTIGGSSATVLQKLQALSTKRQMLAHQSVGANILRGNPADGSGGLSKILADNPTGGVALVVQPSGIAQVPVGAVADYEMATANGYPIAKIDEFDTLFRSTFGGSLDYAGFKFCFADINESTDIAPIWAEYETVMDALEADFPGRVIYWTGALLPWVNGGGNTKREALNDQIRAKYGSTGRVFDLALMERTDASGNLVTRDDPDTGAVEAIPAMAYEWCADWTGSGTASDGHPNNIFAARVANAYVDLVFGLATR